MTPRRLNKTVAVLFMVGSAGFVIGSLGAFASAVGPRADAITFFIASLFFTSASFGQLLQSQSPALAASGTPRDDRRQPIRWLAWLPHDNAWLAAALQFPGTLFFNATTLRAVTTSVSSSQYDAVVWRPDFFGSILFLVSSAFAVLAVGRFFSWRPRSDAWRIAWLNMLGSIAFMASAIGAYVLPSSGAELDVSLADRGTLLGAVCFLVGAALAIPGWSRTTGRPESRSGPVRAAGDPEGGLGP